MKALCPLAVIALLACTSNKSTSVESQPEGSSPETSTPKNLGGSAPDIESPRLLLAQAQFTWSDDNGKRTPKPGAAKLRILSLKGDTFQETVLEDEDSRVFHKALCVDEEGLSGLLTIAATDAHLKLWKATDSGWNADTLWTGRFGGKFDRLRDVEIGDVDGDGSNELVIATHDQGVVVVLDRNGDEWTPTTVFEKQDTFVHEIELGDTDGDGIPEIYATPSKPNRANASQSGSILNVRYDPKTKKYISETVIEFEGSHAKEILVGDLDSNQRDELYAAVEASIKPVDGKLTVDHPVAVRRFDKKGESWAPSDVAEFPDGLQSRVLLLADLTKRGAEDLIVTTMKSGVWRVAPKDDGSFEKEAIDKDSGGFEHAAHAADLDNDGQPELYVTSDDNDEVRRYVWDGEKFGRTVIATLEKSDLVWNITSCK
ncbi:MAG: VCBS repeat-containing protein [Myxococcota bacterium]